LEKKFKKIKVIKPTVPNSNSNYLVTVERKVVERFIIFCNNNNNNNLRLLRLRQTAQPTMITTTACHAGQQQQGLARA